jgi:hypothetical protein
LTAAQITVRGNKTVKEMLETATPEPMTEPCLFIVEKTGKTMVKRDVSIKISN